MTTEPESPGIPHAPAERNGAAFRPDAGTLIGRGAGKAIGELLLPLFQALPQMIAQALGDKPMCGKCALARARWDRVYGDQMTFARLRACQAAEISPDDPAAAGLNLAEFLPPELLPGAPGPDAMPATYQAIAYVNGWGLCHPHVQAEEAVQAAAEPAQVPQRPPLLLARPGVGVTAAASAARQNAPGMPGYAAP
jgi:hypothetical protein